MKILVACEESQAVTIELRRLGHEAYSCDIEPCSGGHPEWHLQVDALELLKMKWDCAHGRFCQSRRELCIRSCEEAASAGRGKSKQYVRKAPR